ncbi:MAG: STAS domain-containing protein [Acidobacteriales bacterium]|nr:STAS domain-containing protein [Terriglobales bacterium]
MTGKWVESSITSRPRRNCRYNAGLRRTALRDTLSAPSLAAEDPYVELILTSQATENGVTIVHCVGRIVFGEETIIFRDEIKALIAQNNRIVLNLKEVTYMDSGGLGTMVSLFTSARIAGGSIKLTNLNDRVGDLLHMTKLVTVFEVYDDDEEAVESFAKSATA